MKFKEVIFGFAMMLANVAVGLMTIGMFAHLAWYALLFGWQLVP